MSALRYTIKENVWGTGWNVVDVFTGWNAEMPPRTPLRGLRREEAVSLCDLLNLRDMITRPPKQSEDEP